MENNDRGKNPVQISYISVLLYCWNHHIIMKFKCLLLMYNCWCIIPPLLLLAQHIQVAELLLNYSKYFWLNQVLLVSDSDEQSYSELQKKKKIIFINCQDVQGCLCDIYFSFKSHMICLQYFLIFSSQSLQVQYFGYHVK